jgi:signal peptidase I
MASQRSIAQMALIAVTMTLGAAVFLLIVTGAVRSWRNATGSMEPTLPVGSRMLVIRSSRANRGDIVTFRYPLDERVTFVKRIVGVAGDTVELRDKKLIVNGKSVAEPFVMHEDDEVYPNNPAMPEPYRSRDQFGPFHVPAGQLFVLGDNRDHSNDSRYFGTVGRKMVIGHPILLYSWKRGVWLP